MKNTDENNLIDKAMAGRLTAGEQGRWEALVAQRPDLAMETELGRALRELPKPPAVSTNFTALVLQAIRTPEPRTTSWFAKIGFPRLGRVVGTAAVVLGVGVGVIRYQTHERQVADSVKNLAGGVATLTQSGDPNAEQIVTALQDFEAIRKLPVSSGEIDYGLLAALNANE